MVSEMRSNFQKLDKFMNIGFNKVDQDVTNLYHFQGILEDPIWCIIRFWQNKWHAY